MNEQDARKIAADFKELETALNKILTQEDMCILSPDDVYRLECEYCSVEFCPKYIAKQAINKVYGRVEPQKDKTSNIVGPALILADNAEKYAELITESKMKSDNIAQVEAMIKNPETIEIVALAFADNLKSNGLCYGPHVNIYDKDEQIEALGFFAQFMEKQLDGINQKIKPLYYKDNMF